MPLWLDISPVDRHTIALTLRYLCTVSASGIFRSFVAEVRWKMRRSFCFILFFMLGIPFGSQIVFAHDDADLSNPALPFIENKGQNPEQVLFDAPFGQGRLFLEQDRWVYQVIDRPHRHGQGEPNFDYKKAAKGHVFRMWFEGANMKAPVRASFPRVDYVNYFRGNDPAKWASYVKQYTMVEYEDMYSCIDMSVYSKDNNLKYDFIVRPGGDPQNIDLRFEGMNKLSLVNGELVIALATGELKELAPYAYQLVDGKERKVECRFVLKEDRVSFEFPKGYDEAQELIIDPTVVFASYVGSTADSWGFTATYDIFGHLYGGSLVFDSGYPTTVGEFDPFDNSFNGGGTDWGITKFSPDGSSLIFSTYVGGSRPDVPQSLVVNNKGELVILGTTGSSNFPIPFTGAGSIFNGGPSVNITNMLSTFTNGTDIALMVLAEDGGSIVGGSFFGGSGTDGFNQPPNGPFPGGQSLQYNYGDVARGEVIVDESDNIYIGSSTLSNDIQSAYSSASFQVSNEGGQDGIVAKFSPDLSNLDWWSYLGGDDDDAVYSIKVNSAGVLYACGGTESDDFPVGNGGLWDDYQGGSTDGYVISVNQAGSAIVDGTFLGTNQYDQAYFVEIDRQDEDVYVVGQCRGSYPVSGDVYSNSGGKQFVHQLTPDLGATVVSTVFGANNEINISPTALMVDECGRVYVSGWGGITNQSYNTQVGSTFGLPVTSDAVKGTTDGSDFYFIVFLSDLSELYFGSFYGGSQGGNGAEHVDGGTSRFSPDGVIYQAVCAGCGGNSLFPTTNGAWSETNPSSNCNLGLIKYDIEPPLIDLDLTNIFVSCSDFETIFTIAEEADGFIWDMGDGTMETGNPVFHIYEDPGVYFVEVIGIDSSTCNITDTATAEVTVLLTQFLEFDVIVPGACVPPIIDLTNIAIDVVGPDLSEYDFTFDLGDGTVIDNMDMGFTYEYSGPGSYILTMSTDGPDNLCIPPYAVTIVIPENYDVLAQAAVDDTICTEIGEIFIAESPAQEYLWDFGDGEMGSGSPATHIYDAAGNYQVQLISIDSLSCNKSDTTFLNVVVDESPDLAFDALAPPICVPMEVATTNNSTVAGNIADYTFTWNFGDGTVIEGFEPNHTYANPGFYTITMTVTGPDPCLYDVTTTVLIPESFYVEVSMDIPQWFCTDETVQFNSTGNGIDYVWDFGDGNDGVGSDPTHIFDAPGLYDIMVIALDPTTCNLSDTATSQVQVYLNPTISFDVIEPPACAPPIVVVTNTSIVEGNIADYTFTWDMGNGTVLEEFAPEYEYPEPGDYVISLTVDGPSLCLYDVDQNISIPESFYVDLEIQTPDWTCTSESEVFSTESPAEEYFWDFGDGEQAEGPIVDHSYDLPGVYDVQLIAIDSMTCNFSDTANAQITVYLDPSIDFSALIPPACVAPIVDFTNNSIVEGNPNDYTFIWDMGDGTILEEFDPSYEYEDSGDYIVTLLVDGPSPCLPKAASDTINIPESIYIDIVLELADTACSSLSQLFVTQSYALDYFWDFGDGTYGEGPFAIHEYDMPGTYEITLIGSDPNSCNGADTAMASITIYEQPEAFFTHLPDEYLWAGEMVTFDNLSTPGMEYEWDLGGELISNEFEPVHSFLPGDSIEVCLTAINPEGGCSDTYCNWVLQFSDFGVPGAFSPNGDGVNDDLGIPPFGLPRMRLLVFNRWGQKIFDNDPRHHRWDGTYNGQPQELGVYLWMIDATDNFGRDIVLKGDVTLIR